MHTTCHSSSPYFFEWVLKWCLDVKYVRFKFQLNMCNYRDVILHKTMKFLCIKQEHSHMSFKNNVSFIWMFKILYTYKYRSHYKNTKFIQFFVRTYEKWFSHKICMNLWIMVSLWSQSLFGFTTPQILLILGVLFKRLHIVIKSGSV
jgi:hypothetical protein